jgi:hypothetical protein
VNEPWAPLTCLSFLRISNTLVRPSVVLNLEVLFPLHFKPLHCLKQ